MTTISEDALPYARPSPSLLLAFSSSRAASRAGAQLIALPRRRSHWCRLPGGVLLHSSTVERGCLRYARIHGMSGRHTSGFSGYCVVLTTVRRCARCRVCSELTVVHSLPAPRGGYNVRSSPRVDLLLSPPQTKAAETGFSRTKHNPAQLLKK